MKNLNVNNRTAVEKMNKDDAAAAVKDKQQAQALIARIDARAQRHMVEFEGRKICWRSFGQGRPLVLLHGGHGSWLHWIRNIEALSLRHTVWMPDMPGYGDSDGLPEGLSEAAGFDWLVNAVVATLDMLVGDDTEIDLVGFSFGGMAAARFYAQRDRVRRLALLGSGGHGGRRREQMQMIDWRGAKDDAEMTAAMRHNLAALMLHDPDHIDDLALAVHTVSCKRARFRSKEISLSGHLRELLDRRSQPVLLAWGEHDVTAEPEAAGRDVANGDAARKWHVIPGAGHWVQYERPQELNRLLLDWFGE